MSMVALTDEELFTRLRLAGLSSAVDRILAQQQEIDELHAQAAAGRADTDSGISDADADQLNHDISAAYGLTVGSLAWADVCAMKLATESGEVVDAWLRRTGRSRKPGSTADLEGEVADVEICNRMLARALQIDLAAAVRAKLEAIRARGWKNDPS